MNRIKSKQNLNPNSLAHNKKDQQLQGKTRNQSRPLFKQNPNNPQKSAKKNNIKKKDDIKHEKESTKTQVKKPNLSAQLYYQEDILQLTTKQATKNFKNYKQLQQNKIYRAYRQNLIESIYQQCQKFQLKSETFYLYVYFLDSFMKTEAGRKQSLENTVIASYACFLMAQKYQEIYPPSINDWLDSKLHQKVYIWQGKIIFALNFKFLHESLHKFFQYWSKKFELKFEQKQSCMVGLDSIVFNYELMYKYEPHKIAKAMVLIEIENQKKKSKIMDQNDPFESAHEKNKIMSDIKKHIIVSMKRIEWISERKN